MYGIVNKSFVVTNLTLNSDSAELLVDEGGCRSTLGTEPDCFHFRTWSSKKLSATTLLISVLLMSMMSW